MGDVAGRSLIGEIYVGDGGAEAGLVGECAFVLSWTESARRWFVRKCVDGDESCAMGGCCFGVERHTRSSEMISDVFCVL